MNKVTNTLKTFVTRRLVLSFDKVDFTYTNLSWKRLTNWFLTELSYYMKSTRAWGYPTHLQIEPTNICNLRCPLCHVVTDDKPKGSLKFDDFKRIMDEVGETLLFLHFWGWGEPFLNKEFFQMIKYAKGKGIKIITSTNGHFFEEEEDVDQLIESGLDVLIFALDGVDHQTYEKYRQKGDFDRALRGLRLLLRRKEEQRASFPRINLRMLVTRDNEDQIIKMKNLAEELGVDILTIKTLCSFDNIAKWETMVPLNPEYQRFEYDEDGNPIRQKNTCKKPWNHPTIYLDGTVVPCDYHTGQEFSLGNMFTHNGRGFHHVWFSKEYRDFRSRFLKTEPIGLRCDDCSLNYAGVERCASHAFEFGEK